MELEGMMESGVVVPEDANAFPEGTPCDPALVMLETERLVFRRFTDTDADASLLLDLNSDPEVMRYLGPFGGDSVEAYREHIRLWLPYYSSHAARGFWATYEKTTGFIGCLFIRPAPDYRFATEAGWTSLADLELGYRFKRAAWGRGLCTEGASALVRTAFEDPAIERVVAAALVPNRASTRVMEKLGMMRIREFELPGFSDPSAMYALSRVQHSLFAARAHRE